MTLKRNLSSLRGHRRDAAKKTKQSIHNIFLKLGSSSWSGKSDEGLAENRIKDLLAHTVDFLRINSKNPANKREKSRKGLLKSLDYLTIRFEGNSVVEMSESNSTELDAPLASTAAMLLPWIGGELLDAATNSDTADALLWRTLSATLNVLTTLSDKVDNKNSLKQNAIIQALTSKALVKLTPQALRTALTNDSAVSDATICYQILLRSGHFVPSLHVVYRSLFAVIVNILASSDHSKLRSRSIILTTLQVWEDSLNKANPKTAFQVLSTEEVLLNWSWAYFYLEDLHNESSEACQKVMLNILWTSLFHPDHHFGGFYSLVRLRGIPTLDRGNRDSPTREPMESDPQEVDQTSSNRFQCYQENLLSSLEKMMLVPSTLHATSSRPNLTQSVLVTELLPLLLQGFLQKLNEFEAKNRLSPRKKGSQGNLAEMQLFFFGTTASLLWQRRSLCWDDQNIISKQCLQSLSRCLKLFVQHDAFVLANDDKQINRSNFLESLMVGMLQTPSGDGDNCEHTSSILETLMRLDHYLVHERLENIVGFVSVSTNDQESDKNATSTSAPAFFVSLFETYHQLRQFHRVFDSFLAVVSTLQVQDKAQQLCSLHSTLSHSFAKRAFARAIIDSPIQEVKRMFECLDRWIVQASTTSKWIPENGHKSLEIAIEHFAVGFLRNVKVDKGNAQDIAGFCRTIMSNSVRALCRESGGCHCIAERNKFGIKLCSWIISLQMRIAFWLGYHYFQKCEIELSIPQSVRRLLQANDFSASLSSTDMKPLLGDLAVLVSFRLRKLEYLIHEQSLVEADELSSLPQLEEEARRLARLMSSWAIDTHGQASMWRHIAHMTPSWLPYADEDHLKSFLVWMFSVLADAKAGKCSREREVTRALLSDASFFELHELSEHLAPCALDTIALLVREALSVLSMSELSIEDELCLINHPDWMQSSPSRFSRLFKRGNITSFGDNGLPEATITFLRGALRVAKILCELPTFKSSSFSAKCADSAARIQSVCCHLDSDHPDEIALVIDLVSALRLVCAKYFAAAGKEALHLLPTARLEIKEMLVDVMDTTICMIKLVNDFSKGPGKKVLFANVELVKGLCGCHLLAYYSKTLILDALVDFSKAAFRTNREAKESETIVLCALGRAISTCVCFEQIIRYEFGALEELLLIFFDWLTALTKDTYSTQCSELVCEQVRLFAGAAFRWASKGFEDCIPALVTEKMTVLVNDLLTSKLLNECRRPILEATSYMAMGYSLSNPPVHQRISLIDILLRTDCDSQTLNASICHLVSGMDDISLRRNLLKVKHRILEGRILGLRLFQLLLQQLKVDGQIDCLTSLVDAILGMALEFLSISSDLDAAAKNASIASSLIVELAEEKSLMTVRERHVALFLAQASQVLLPTNLGDELYSLCFRLVAALVQRFPKQMRACISSLMAVFHAFQRRVLYGELDDNAARERSRRFTRLCELLLPHKEVCKKHVVCLILEFVHCLENGLSWVRKECFLPSFFCLLDMLSKYEMKQLNILMNITEKALFRSLHQSYNKLHAYKGR